MESHDDLSVGVVYAANSPESAISKLSALQVEEGLKSFGYETELMAFTQPSDITVAKVNAFFPVMHGKDGEDGLFASICDKYGFRYVGSSEAASKLCYNKATYKDFLLGNNISTPKSEIVTPKTFSQSPLKISPFVLKPITGGSSIDTFIVRNPAGYDEIKINNALHRHNEMLLEELVEGIEITAGVLDNQALPVVEIIPPENQEFDFTNKYNGSTTELCPPQNIDVQLQQKIQSLALTIHTLAGCRHYSRTDMMITPSGELFVLETNTLPGMTSESLFPKAAAAAGVPFTTLLDRLVHLAVTS